LTSPAPWRIKREIVLDTVYRISNEKGGMGEEVIVGQRLLVVSLNSWRNERRRL